MKITIRVNFLMNMSGIVCLSYRENLIYYSEFWKEYLIMTVDDNLFYRGFVIITKTFTGSPRGGNIIIVYYNTKIVSLVLTKN